MKKRWLAICLLITAAILVSARWATSTVEEIPADVIQTTGSSLAAALSVEDMTAQADTIAIGNCVEVKSAWAGRTLVTLATVEVIETLKGEDTPTLTVVLPGGVDVNRTIPISMTYAGAPRITPGEDVFLFLTRDSEVAGGYTVAGFSQGKFSIVKDDEGEQVVTRDLTKTVLSEKNGLRRGQSEMTPLGQLKAEVKRHLKN
jgi:hypothetical protein